MDNSKARSNYLRHKINSPKMLKCFYDLILERMFFHSIQCLHEKLGVPEFFLRYLLLIEDKRFIFHFGIDPIAIARALINNLIYRDLHEGASTITQQLYSAHLEINGEEYNRQIDGKLKQMIWALLKEVNSSKNEIISEYIKTIYWGRNYYGLDQAADGYFGITRKQLSHEQSFFLAERIAWPNIINFDRIKKIISISQIFYDFENYERLENLTLIYDQTFQCKENLCLILER
jgi:Transglycosylase